MNAMILAGGWQGHDPQAFADWAQGLLEPEGFTVHTFETLEPLSDEKMMRDIDLIIPIWSSARSSHQNAWGNMNYEQEQGLLAAVKRGTGIAGWHGHMGDAFRDRPNYHFLVGGQFVAHPPGWPDNPVPQDDFVPYTVNITSDDPIVAGIEDFAMYGEQYYLHVDPSNDVLATTTFSGEYLPWIAGAVMPVVWKRYWGEGRVFYCSIGHEVRELNLPQVREIIRRGVRWASKFD